MRTRSLILALAILLAVPTFAVASWNIKGSHEPASLLDTPEYMWQGPDQTALGSAQLGSKVYFNTYIYQSADPHFDHGTLTVNPNFATLDTAHQGWMGQVVALLGVWKDCNKDGYVGLQDNALFVYRSTLLLDTSVCPPHTIPPVQGGSASHNSIAYANHNDGTWVHEFVPLGPDTAASNVKDQNPYDLNDNAARVWADWGVPGAAPPPSRCYIFTPQSTDINNHPEWGTMHSTGGMLNFVDCWDDYGAVDKFDTVVDANAATKPMSFSDTTPASGDSQRDYWNSSSTLNQRNPWGLPGGSTESNTIVDSWNCNGAPVAKNGGNQVSAPRVPPAANAHGTAAATVEYESDGLYDCNAATDPPAAQGGSNQESYQLANAPYSQEKAGFNDASGVKESADHLLSYSEGFQPAADSAALGNSGPKDAGLGDDAGDSDGLWIADATVSEDRNPFVDRNALRGPDTSSPTAWNPVQKVQYLTAYADVSATAISAYNLWLPSAAGPGGSPSTFTYGQDACLGATTGIVNSWNCDGSQWYRGNCDPNLGYSCSAIIANVPTDISIRPGQAYNLRDVECYDNSVEVQGHGRSDGVGYGLATGTKCQ